MKAARHGNLMNPQMDAFGSLLHFLNRLESHAYCYSLHHEHADAILVRINGPEERWEVQFRTSGEIELETFTSTGQVLTGPDATAVLERLFKDTGSDA